MTFIEFYLIIALIHLKYTQSDRSWHALQNPRDPSSYKFYNSDLLQSIREGWNFTEFAGNINSTAYQELQFDEAIEIIYKHQHPDDCTKVKFVLGRPHPVGFGAELHLEGWGIALAMELDRVYIPLPVKNWEQRDNRMPESLCYKKRPIDCYFEKFTSCTIDDVMERMRGLYTEGREFESHDTSLYSGMSYYLSI